MRSCGESILKYRGEVVKLSEIFIEMLKKSGYNKRKYYRKAGSGYV